MANVWRQKPSQTDAAFFFSSLLNLAGTEGRPPSTMLQYTGGKREEVRRGTAFSLLEKVLHSRRGMFISSVNTVEEFDRACRLIESSQKVDSKYHPVLLFFLASASNTEPGVYMNEPGPTLPPVKLLWILKHETSNEFRVRSCIELLMSEPGALGLNLYTTADVEFANQGPRAMTARSGAIRWLKEQGLPNLESQIRQYSAEQEAAYNNRQRLEKLKIDANRFLQDPVH